MRNNGRTDMEEIMALDETGELVPEYTPAPAAVIKIASAPKHVSYEEALILQAGLMLRAARIIKAKRADYGGSDDPLANFRVAGMFGFNPAAGAFLRMMDKIMRLSTLMQKEDMEGEVEDEPIGETLADLLNYVVIVGLLLAEHNPKLRAYMLAGFEIWQNELALADNDLLGLMFGG